MSKISSAGAQNSKVYLNVYDLHESNDILYQFGLGLYHSGVQIGREEYTFASGGGIFDHEPKQAPGAKFRESIEIGNYNGNKSNLSAVLNEMRAKFGGNDYNLLTRNCNTFADEFLQRLLGKESPPFVNRMATIGSFFSCLLPESISGKAPVTNGSDSPSTAAVVQTNVFASTTGIKLGASTASTDAPPAGLNDRRERMRAAAMARLN